MKTTSKSQTAHAPETVPAETPAVPENAPRDEAAPTETAAAEPAPAPAPAADEVITTEFAATSPTEAAPEIALVIETPAAEAAPVTTFGRVRGSTTSVEASPSARQFVMSTLADSTKEYRVADLHALCGGKYTKANISSALFHAGRAGLVVKTTDAARATWWAIATAE